MFEFVYRCKPFSVGSLTLSPTYPASTHNPQHTMATSSKIPWDKLKADTLRAICRDLGANPGKRKREGMLEFLRAVETTGRASRLRALPFSRRSLLNWPPHGTIGHAQSKRP